MAWHHRLTDSLPARLLDHLPDRPRERLQNRLPDRPRERLPDRLRDRLRSERPNPLAAVWRETVAASTPAQRALAFLGVPVVLLVVGTLPPSIQLEWGLVLQEPQLPQLLLSSVVHASVQHLSHNVLGFLGVMAFLFPLAALSDRLRTLGVVAACLLLVLPVAVSLQSLHALAGRQARVLGFSGTVAGFLGAVPVFATVFVRERLVPGLPTCSTAAGVVAGLVGYLALFQGRTVVGVALLCGATVLVGQALWRSDLGARTVGDSDLFLLGMTTVAVTGMLEQNLFTAPPGVNVYAHVAGFLGGFVLAAGVVLVAGWSGPLPWSDGPGSR